MPPKRSSQGLSATRQRRQREKELRYRNILEAAEHQFCEHGYANTKIQDIAQAAEVAVGTVYFYFRNKEDLLLQLVDTIAYNIRDILGKAFRSGTNPIERFENAGRAYFHDFCLAYPSQLLILLRESVGITPEVESARRAILERVNKDVVNAIEELMKENNIHDRLVAEVATVAICGMLERVAIQYLIWEDRTHEIDIIVQEAQAFIRGGLFSILDNLKRQSKGTGASHVT